MILVALKHWIVLLDTFTTTGTGPFSKYLFPASHKERVPAVASSTVAPVEQLGSSFLGQPLLMLQAPQASPKVRRLGPSQHRWRRYGAEML